MLRILAFVTFLLAAAYVSAAPTPQPQISQRAEFSVIRDYARPILIKRKASFLSLSGDQIVGSASAIVIAPGYATTSYHVFGGIPKDVTVVHVMLVDEDEITVKMVAKDEDNDVVIIKGNFKCPCAPLTKKRPYQDQEAYAVGFPAYSMVQSQFVTWGHVQNKPDAAYILTTTNTGPGGSGGGIFVKEDGKWKLAGIVTAIGRTPLAPNVAQEYNWMLFSSPVSNVQELLKKIPDAKTI